MDTRSNRRRDAEPDLAKFPLGRVVITPTAAMWLSADMIARCLERHAAGDWGDVGAELAWENDQALTDGGILRSAYFKHGPSFTIVTRGDPRVTTVKMSSEYHFQPPADDMPAGSRQ